LAVRRTAPAGGAKRGPPRSQGTPERARLTAPVMGSQPNPSVRAGGPPACGLEPAVDRKALCSFQALQMDKLDDRRPAEMAARFGETPEPTVNLVGHSQVRQPAQENTLVK
jgi:hypothetical protein